VCLSQCVCQDRQQTVSHAPCSTHFCSVDASSSPSWGFSTLMCISAGSRRSTGSTAERTCRQQTSCLPRNVCGWLSNEDGAQICSCCQAHGWVFRNPSCCLPVQQYVTASTYTECVLVLLCASLGCTSHATNSLHCTHAPAVDANSSMLHAQTVLSSSAAWSTHCPAG
jgi:hypothetical protein